MARGPGKLLKVVADRWDFGSDALIGFLASVTGVAGSFAATGYTALFVASLVERLLTRSMAGIVVSFAIENLEGMGQRLNLLFALAIATLK